MLSKVGCLIGRECQSLTLFMRGKRLRSGEERQKMRERGE